LFTAS